MQAPTEYATNAMSIKDTAEIYPKLIASMNWGQRETALDYGCGPGRSGYRHILPIVENNNSTMISVDCSEKVIEYAKENFSHERITYSVGDVLGHFPFEKCTFDKAFAFYVFHFVEDIRRALEGLRDVLKPGGQLGFATLLANNLWFQTFRILLTTKPWNGFMKECQKFFPMWSLYEGEDYLAFMSNLIKECGLTVNKLEIEKKNAKFDDFEQGIDHFMCVTPNLLLPPTQVALMRKEYRRIITELLGIPLDSIGFTFHYDVVIGVVQKPLPKN